MGGTPTCLARPRGLSAPSVGPPTTPASVLLLRVRLRLRLRLRLSRLRRMVVGRPRGLGPSSGRRPASRSLALLRRRLGLGQIESQIPLPLGLTMQEILRAPSEK